MSESRRDGAGGFEDQLVLEGVREMLLSADDVRDAQVGIVGAVRQVIGGHAVTAQKCEIFDIGIGLGLFAVDGVLELDVAGATWTCTPSTAASVCLLSVAMISGGVPLGTPKPIQPAAS